MSAEAGLSSREREPMSNDELPAAFWDAMPGEDHPDLAAMNAIKDEMSPDEQVETLKVSTSQYRSRLSYRDQNPEWGLRLYSEDTRNEKLYKCIPVRGAIRYTLHTLHLFMEILWIILKMLAVNQGALIVLPRGRYPWTQGSTTVKMRSTECSDSNDLGKRRLFCWQTLLCLCETWTPGATWSLTCK